MNNLFLGISLISVTALANGVFSIPLRRRRRYAVENMWIIGFVLGNFALPHLAAAWLVPGWFDAIRSVPTQSLLLALAMGAGWGVASVFFSQAIARVGLSLGYALIMGLIMVTGSAVPMVRNAPSSAGVWTLSAAGILVALAGVALAGRAGMLRERAQAPAGTGQHRGRTFAAGLFFCAMAGLLSACSNLGYDLFKSGLARHIDGSTHPALASMVPFLPLYWSGPAVVIAISLVQLTRNRTWGNYRGPGARHDLKLSLLMAGCFALTQIPYGMGAAYMGDLGTSIGFAISMVLSLAVANVVGVFGGEWRGAGRRAGGLLVAGLACLGAAVALLTWASS